jgi:ABC-type cobalamin/Fe3+-siderophores transport system ATPase subunit/predicted  nucleic acid-binding Zn-ribbon protein
VVVKEDRWDDLDWKGRSGAERSQLVTKADAFFVQKDADRDWFLGKGPDMTPETFIDRFRAQVPAIRGSDSHSFDDFCHPDKDRFCWIKADTTWEGLKQIKYEPETRVQIGPENPQRRVSIHTPDELRIRNGKINNRLEIKDTTLPLNANLVTVIGGKGAGKTALLDLLANCFQNQHVPDDKVSEDAGSFIERTQTADSADSVRTCLKFAGEDVEPFVKDMLDDEVFTRSRLEYLPQGKIAEFCRNDAVMHGKVLELVKEAMTVDHGDVLRRFEETQNEIDDIVEQLEARTNELHELNPRTIDTRIDDVSNELDALDGDIADKREEIEEFREAHDEELHEESIDELEDKLAEVEDRLDVATALLDTLEHQRERLDEIRAFNESAHRVASQANELGLDISTSTIDCSSLEAEVERHVSRVSTKMDDLEDRQTELQQALDGLQDVNGDLSQLRTELRDLKDEFESLKKRREQLKETRERIEDLREQRTDDFHQYLRLYDRLQTEYSEMISHFQDGKSDILEDVEFRAELQLRDGVQSSLFELLDGRSVNYEELTDGVNALATATDIPDDVHQYINDYIDSLIGYTDRLKSGSSQAEYEQRVFSDHVELGERILLDGTPMSRLSLGQKGTVLLKILLVEDDKPLIIDQPEENLDNRFIYDTLRDAFRKAKTDRQVIIATHNANLVVNTDAEQVVVATYDDNVISFESGALENPSIRTQVAQILEGGQDAFMRREQKYNFEP